MDLDTTSSVSSPMIDLWKPDMTQIETMLKICEQSNSPITIENCETIMSLVFILFNDKTNESIRLRCGNQALDAINEEKYFKMLKLNKFHYDVQIMDLYLKFLIIDKNDKIRNVSVNVCLKTTIEVFGVFGIFYR